MFDVNGYPPQKSKHEEEKKVIDAHVMKQPEKKKIHRVNITSHFVCSFSFFIMTQPQSLEVFLLIINISKTKRI